MSDNRRVIRFAELLKKEIGYILESKVNNPDKGFVTINGVKVSQDLKIADVYYSVLGDDEQKKKTKNVLERSKGFIKNELKPSITTRWLPELRFHYDNSIEYAAKINAILDKIHDDTHSDEGE